MRIALAHPVYWPEVRRGSERVVHDLGAGLAGRGHEVTILTTHAAPADERVEDGVRVRRVRRPPPIPGLGLYELYLETLPQLAWQLRQGDYDLVHAFFLSTALGAVEARRVGGPPVVYSFHGIPTRTYLVARRRRLRMLRRAIGGAARTTVLSAAAAAPFRRYLGFDPVILPAGVDVTAFGPGERDPSPTLFCAAAFNDPRKRVPMLLDAFAELRSARSDVRLRLTEVPGAGDHPPLPGGVEWAPAGSERALAGLYASAWATVLPSVDEAQGLVLLESLASGTPVVASRSGFPPEVLDGAPGAGRLFEPDSPADLARAMAEALDLGTRPETAAECRARSADFSWDALLPRHEELYEGVLAGEAR